MFFLGITVIFLLFFIFVYFGIFLSKPSETPSMLVFNKPKVNIDMSVFTSDQFKNLQPLVVIKTQYSYKATTKGNNPKEGFIFADSEATAKADLEAQGLKVTDLKEAGIGRSNPFMPYYQIATPATPTK